MKALLSAPILFNLLFSPLFAESFSVQVKNAALKEKPSFLSKTIAPLAYGDKVESSEAQGDWYKVTKEKSSGWLHTSSLTAKEIILKNDKETAHGASNTEIVMAGKGFSKEVEDSYKKTNTSLNYADVDTVEKNRPSVDSVTAFAKDGKLSLN